MLLSEREESSILSAWAVEGRFEDAVSAALLMADRTPPQGRVARGLGRGAEAKTKNIFAQGDSCCVIKFTSLRIFSKWLLVFSFRSLTPVPREPTAWNIFEC